MPQCSTIGPELRQARIAAGDDPEAFRRRRRARSRAFRPSIAHRKLASARPLPCSLPNRTCARKCRTVLACAVRKSTSVNHTRSRWKFRPDRPNIVKRLKKRQPSETRSFGVGAPPIPSCLMLRCSINWVQAVTRPTGTNATYARNEAASATRYGVSSFSPKRAASHTPMPLASAA